MKKLMIFAALLLSGCGPLPPLSGTYIAPNQSLYGQLSKSKYSKSIGLGEINSKPIPVAITTNSGLSEITAQSFKEALELSLMQSGLKSEGKPKYTLSANLGSGLIN